MGNGINFGGYESDYANNKQSNFRKAGDAFKTASKREPSKDSAYSKWMTFMGNQNNNSSNNSYSSSNSNNSQPSGNSNTAAPQASQPKASQPAEGDTIDFAAWAADTASGKKSGGQDAAYWEKKYRKNYAEDQERKAKFDAYTGIKTNEEFEAANQANWDKNSTNIDAYTAQMHKDYGEFSTYATLKSQQGHFDKYADKWKM